MTISTKSRMEISSVLSSDNPAHVKTLRRSKSTLFYEFFFDVNRGYRNTEYVTGTSYISFRILYHAKDTIHYSFMSVTTTLATFYAKLHCEVRGWTP
jgi:hypothetical protein